MATIMATRGFILPYSIICIHNSIQALAENGEHIYIKNIDYVTYKYALSIRIMPPFKTKSAIHLLRVTDNITEMKILAWGLIGDEIPAVNKKFEDLSRLIEKACENKAAPNVDFYVHKANRFDWKGLGTKLFYVIVGATIIILHASGKMDISTSLEILATLIKSNN